MWWWIGRSPPPPTAPSEADELRMRKKLLAKEIAAKKLAIKKLKRAIKATREEKFKAKVAAMPARIEQVNVDGLGR